MSHQLIVVFMQMCEYACHRIINRFRRPVAEIRQVSCLGRANNFLDEILLHSRHLMEQAHFLGVHDPHIGVRVGSRAVHNDERTQLSQVNESSGINEVVHQVVKY